MENAKKYAVIAVFALMIFGLAIAHWLLPDAAFSDTERRALEQTPVFSTDALFDGSYQSELETYLLEQFPMRDGFRGLKTVLNVHLWQMRDTNGYYYVDGHWMELDETLDTAQVDHAINKINGILEKHPEIAAAYYAIVPDKNYFLAEQNGYAAMDYEALYAHMENVNAEKIDITSLLSVDDYYRTDSHWRQERLQAVTQALCSAMGVTAAPYESYTQHELEGFSGVYTDHTAYPLISESLVYLENESTDNAVVSRVNEMTGQWEQIPMYDVTEFENVDPYDVYLSGAEALIMIDNPNATSDKHLILFRDSFSSSLAPLLTDSYAKITMVDLRYISSMYLDGFVNFENADVLFLYSTTLLNSAGGVLK